MTISPTPLPNTTSDTKTPTIPLLGEPQCSGIGQLMKRFPCGLQPGADSDRRVVDIQILHTVVLADEVSSVDTFLPGAIAGVGGAFGSGSDGGREQTWKPAKSARRILLTTADGAAVYEGPCDLRQVTLKINSTRSVLLIKIRLHSVDTANLKPLGDLLGSTVHYQMVAEQVTGPLTASPGRGGLPFGTPGAAANVADSIFGSVEIGDLVVALVADEEVSGLAAVVTSSTVTLQDLQGENPRAIPVEAIISVEKICGPRGGSAESSLAKLDPLCRPEHLLIALAEAQDNGEIEQGANGWPLKDTVIDRANEIATELPDEP